MKKIRYAVVGLGHIAQVAVLPAFGHATKNSVLAGLVSDDSNKLKQLGRKYGVRNLADYDGYDALCESGEIDAVYLAVPNHLHRQYTERAARAGVHVLCEKPMAVTVKDAEAMIAACRKAKVKLMIAYRLHFEEANLEAVRMINSGKIGEPRFFSSDFGLDVRKGDIRVRKETGGGSLWDLGIYCLNAARYLFKDEPVEVSAMSASREGDERFSKVEEMVAATLRFPGERLAHFVCSFGSADIASLRVVGTKGDLRLEPAYEYAMPLEHQLTVGEKKTSKKFPKRDQFAPELLHFSGCIQNDREPGPSGEEGLLDVRIIEALYRSAGSGKRVRLSLPEPSHRPTLRQEIRRPPVRKPPKPIGTKPPSRSG
ncbi:MAG TPA: Gfo/Idh/MocA family oxidoreductase [Thermoanaerobaculia bacterium]|nr:Gfo/Idh/MocA family oxidoreductase [Thermoanaerobaculia bacterium]